MSAIITRLPNGLRVVSDPMDTVETVSVGVWVGMGTRHESPDVNGVSHLLEHMAFKGTHRRSARAIAEEIEAVGGHLNAYTSRESTAFYAKILKEDLGLAVDVIGDILQNAVMDDEELARERTVIIQEINQSRDTPDDVIFDRFQETAFPAQALGRPVMGSEELVRDMPRESILEYLRGHYGAREAVLAAAGRVDHDQLVALAESVFSGLPDTATSDFEPARYVGGDYRESRDLEQAHVVLGFQGLAYEDPDFYALSVLSTLFGGGMSSRLFQEAREKRGLVYVIHSFLSCYLDGGLFGIYAGTGQKEVAELIPLVCDEIRKARDDVTEAEVTRSRAQLKASILMGLESTSSRCEQLARQMLVFGRPVPAAEIIEKVDKVDVESVLRVAKRVTAGTPTLATLGPISGVADFDKVTESLA
jgi:predicted Zn-dependent peptidase